MKVKLFDAINLAIGGMIGGGIFYLNGVAVYNVKDYSPYIWIIGVIICLTVSYSYIILGLEYPSNDGTIKYPEELIKSKTINSIIGLFILIGYISLVCVYAMSFGFYTSNYFNIPKFYRMIAILAILSTLILNYIPEKYFESLTDSLVTVKVILFIAIIAYGLFAKSKLVKKQPTLFGGKKSGLKTILPILTILSFGLSSFLSFEGFEMISNTTKDLEDREKNLPYAYVISVIIVGLIYMGITYVTYKHIGNEVSHNNKYSSLLNLVKKYGFTTIGPIIIVILSSIANITAINSTLFTKRKILSNLIPYSNELGKKTKKESEKEISIPFMTDFLGQKRELSIWICVALAIALVFAPEAISTNLGSMSFLLIFLIVGYTGYLLVLKKEKKKKDIKVLGTKIKPIVSKSIIGFGMTSCALGIIYLIYQTIMDT